MKAKRKNIKNIKPRVTIGFNIGTKVFKSKKAYNRKAYKIVID
jgi:hypothetical protein